MTPGPWGTAAKRGDAYPKAIRVAFETSYTVYLYRVGGEMQRRADKAHS